MITIVPIYAAILALWLVGLSFRVIKFRRKFQVAVGDGGKVELQRAIRVQGNFSEYIPLAILLVSIIEFQGGPAALVHAFGCALVLGRLLHSYGVSNVDENLRFRQAGMVLTFLTIGSSSLYIIAHSIKTFIS